MKDDILTRIVKEELKKETQNIIMSKSLRDKIRMETTRKLNIFDRIKSLMDTTIEIPVLPAVALCFIVLGLLYLPFNIPKKTMNNESIIGSTEYRVVQSGNMCIIFNKDYKGDIFDEKN